MAKKKVSPEPKFGLGGMTITLPEDREAAGRLVKLLDELRKAEDAVYGVDGEPTHQERLRLKRAWRALHDEFKKNIELPPYLSWSALLDG